MMIDDRLAEHVPGCNMAIRRDALLAINGFNPIYLRAGDDVDVCWRLQARGGKIGFSPAALVWHHHRPSISGYLRQQIGYGEGEAWLMLHHPDKFVGGRAVWQGRIYSALPFIHSLTGKRIDAGVWGTAAFPSVYHPAAHPLKLLPHSPTWLVLSVATVIAGLVAGFQINRPAAGLLLSMTGGLALLISGIKCLGCAFANDERSLPQIRGLGAPLSRFVVGVTIAWLHFLQPLARQIGALRGWLAPADHTAKHPAPAMPAHRWLPSASDFVHGLRVCCGVRIEERFWGHAWTTGEAVLTCVVNRLRGQRPTRYIAVDDGWQLDRDVSVPVGTWAWMDLRALVEDTGLINGCCG